MKKLLEQVAAIITDYRSGELPTPDADDVGRWVEQFEVEERKQLLEELIHVWNQIYVSKSEAEGFLKRIINNEELTAGDPKAFWGGTEFLDIQEKGHSQTDLLALFKPILRAETDLRIAACGGASRFIYIDDVLFTGNRIKSDLSAWLADTAPAISTVYVLLMGVHSFGEWRLKEDLQAKAKDVGKTLNLEVYRAVSLENRKYKKDVSDVLWPTALPPAAAMYAGGNTGHVPRIAGGASELFSSEAARHNLEQALLKAGIRIRGFCQNPKPFLRPLGYGPFGVGFGSMFASWRNCPNNAPLALWWGDPASSKSHPFSKWRPLLPRKLTGEKMASERLAAPRSQFREYRRDHAAVFLKTREQFGGLSNMAPGFPLRVNGMAIRTSEALYQACRFPHRPELQGKIIEQVSPMTAKMVGKPYRDDSRPDWDRVRTKIMRWCLQVKLAQNYRAFSELLLSTGDQPIVEQSSKDDFWGAKPVDGAGLIGCNILGRLLMELRETVRSGNPTELRVVEPLALPDFLLLGRAIETIGVRAGGPPREQASSPDAPPPDALKTPKEFMYQTVTPAIRKKLIEVSIPLEAINVASAREKSIRHGHPSTLHLWWARRPLAACRAVLFAQLVDDPSSWPDRFPTEEAQDAERRRLHKVIEELVPWEASNNETILNAARWEIARSVAWSRGEEPPAHGDGPAILSYLQTKAPPVYDPFSGGGSIPLEAQRLGLRAYGSDLNPVAVLIGKALVEIPPKFAGRPPINPKSRAEAAHGEVRAWKGAQGLAEDVRYYGEWMRDEAEKRVGHLYPKATLPDGSRATVIAWLWARTVRSPDPAAKGAMVPLVSSFMLSTKEGKKVWVEPVVDASCRDGWRFDVKTGVLSKADEENLRNGTKSAKGQAFICTLTGSPIERPYIQAEGKADRLSERLMAVVAQGTRERVYLSPTPEHENSALEADSHPEIAEARATFLASPTPTRAEITGGVCSAYGLRTWGHLFTSRQTATLLALSDLGSSVREKVLSDVAGSAWPDDELRLHEGGAGQPAYADAVQTYLAFALSKVANIGSSVAGWMSDRGAFRETFARQGIAMVWDFAESNPLGDAGGSFTSAFDKGAMAIAEASCASPGEIKNLVAQRNSFSAVPIIVSTDPPYFDNIGYATLSDFFYVWLRRSLGQTWPDLFRRLTSPKDEELVATPHRHGGKTQAEAFFMAGMGEALTAMHDAAADELPLTIYYAFKQSELAEEGVTSAGWASFLQAVVDAGLSIDGTWPVRTESAGRLVGRGANALASSIVLVCRKRILSADVVTRADLIRSLKREMPAAIDAIRKAGVGPVDMQQSVIGPGMGVFSRHAKVLEDDDSAMSVKTALAIINRVWEEIENELDQAFDPETQVALAWYATYGFDARASGELITLTTAKNTSDRSLFDSGVFKDMKGKAGLTPREELPPGWSPANDKTLTTWECVQHTARVLNAADGGGEAAAALVAQMGPKAEEARALAYRLFEIATNKGWAAEALVYNELAQEWTKLEDRAALLDDAGRTPGPNQTTFAFDGTA